MNSVLDGFGCTLSDFIVVCAFHASSSAVHRLTRQIVGMEGYVREGDMSVPGGLVLYGGADSLVWVQGWVEWARMAWLGPVWSVWVPSREAR